MSSTATSSQSTLVSNEESRPSKPRNVQRYSVGQIMNALATGDRAEAAAMRRHNDSLEG